MYVHLITIQVILKMCTELAGALILLYLDRPYTTGRESRTEESTGQSSIAL